MTTTKKLITLALGIAVIAPFASAQVLVDFGGDYGIVANVDSPRNGDVVVTNVPDGLGTRDEAVLPLSETTPLFSVTGGDLGVSNNVYGALFHSHSDIGATPKGQFNANQYNTTGELYQLDTRNGGSTDTWKNLYFYWNKADFLNGGDSMTLDLADLRVSAAVLAKYTQTVSGEFSFHWVIRDGAGDFFASQNQVAVFANDQYETYTDENLSGLSWVAFDNSSLDVRPTTETAAVVDTSDITGVGVMFSNYKIGNGTGSGLRMQGRVAEFSLTVVPEPSTYALLFGAATLGFVLWRRRRQ